MDKVEIVAQYLAGEMTSEEQVRFLEELAQDQALQEELSLQQDFAIALKNERNKALKSELLAYAEQKAGSNYSWYYGIAAGVSIVIAGLIAFLYLSGSSSKEDFFAANFEPYPYVFTTRLSGNGSAASEAYKNGDFSTAIQLFEKQPMSDTVQFYLGIAYAQTGNLESASARLEQIAPSSIFIPQKNWYLGLIYLQSGDKEGAIAMFSKITEKDYKFIEAQALLGQLEN